MPANYRIITEKFLPAQNEYWSNVYWTDAVSIPDAVVVANAIVEVEKQMHLPQVLITKHRVDDGQPLTDVFKTTPVNLVGLNGGAGDMLPLFNVARFDFEVVVGRPSRKYYRGVLAESWSDAYGQLNATAMSSLTSWAQSIAAISGYVDVDGQDIVSGVAWPRVGMRQLRRGSKKRATL